MLGIGWVWHFVFIQDRTGQQVLVRCDARGSGLGMSLDIFARSGYHFTNAAAAELLSAEGKPEAWVVESLGGEIKGGVILKSSSSSSSPRRCRSALPRDGDVSPQESSFILSHGIIAISLVTYDCYSFRI